MLWPEAFPPLNHTLSPFTGWTRDHWLAVLARMTYGFTLAADRSGSPARALFPDDRRGQADDLDGLEAFARMAVGWAAYLHDANNPAEVSFLGRTLDVAELLAQGLVDGTNPANPHTYWGDVGHMDQRIVEACNLAMALWLSRGRVFDQLSRRAQDQVMAWLEQVDGKGTYPDNWILFPAFGELVRLQCGYPVDAAILRARLEHVQEFYRGEGWYADGAGHAFDLYNAWMFNLHYPLWAWMDGERFPDLRRQVLDRARVFLSTYPHFFGANGAYVAWGRSLTTRFGAVAALAVAHRLGIAPGTPGMLRRLSSGNLKYFVEGGMFDPLDHRLVQGHLGNFPPAGESYMSPGSPYSATHGLLALTLPADDPFWTATEAALPVEDGDFDLTFTVPGMALSGRQATGQVLLANGRSGHYSDVARHDYPPKYGKFVYSSHFPFNVAPVGDAYAPDAALTLTGDGRRFGHRSLSQAGGGAPGFIWCDYDLMVEGEPQAVRSAVLLCGDLQISVSWLHPSLPVRAVQGSGALGCERPVAIVRRSDPAAGWEYAEVEGRAVAIQRLLGYDAQCPSAPFLGHSNLHLTQPYSEQPTVSEMRPSAAPRPVAAAVLARPSPFDPALEFAGLSVASHPTLAGAFDLTLPAGESAFVALGNKLPDNVTVGNTHLQGKGIRFARLADDRSHASGLGVTSVAGLADFDGPATFKLTRTPEVTCVTTDTGVTLEAAWAGPVRALEVLDVDRRWVPLPTPEISTALVSDWSTRTERHLVDFRFLLYCYPFPCSYHPFRYCSKPSHLDGLSIRH